MAQVAPWVQDAEPGAPVAGVMWVKPTTGEVYFRNSANSDWTLVGNINSVGLGLLSRGGGAMTGAITGSHGLAPIDSPSFTGTPTIEGEDVATEAWVIEELEAYQLKG